MTSKNMQKKCTSRMHQIKQTVYKGIAILSLAMMSASSAHAAFVSMDHETFGKNSLTSDSVSGLQWLNFSHGRALSYNQVTSAMGQGGKFEGFRYATRAEVFQLLENFGYNLAGITHNVHWSGDEYWDQSLTTENFSPLENLMSYMGVTGNYGNGRFEHILGTTADSAKSGEHWRINLTSCYTDAPTICSVSGGPADSGGLSIWGFADDSRYTNTGNWLIWDPQSVHPAPEPDTYSMLLLSLGIAGVVVRRRNQCIQ